METDSSSIKYSVRNIICGIFSVVIIISFVVFPKDRVNAFVNPLMKDSRPYKAEIIINLDKKYNSHHYTSRRENNFNTIIYEAANRYGIDAALIKAIIMAESGYNHRAVSKRGAVGLMQLMPATARALGVEDIYDPIHNVNGGTKYIKQLLNKYNGNLELALAAYNAGTRKVKKYKGIPPYRATRLYVKKVFDYYLRYQLAGQA